MQYFLLQVLSSDVYNEAASKPKPQDAEEPATTFLSEGTVAVAECSALSTEADVSGLQSSR